MRVNDRDSFSHLRQDHFTLWFVTSTAGVGWMVAPVSLSAPRTDHHSWEFACFCFPLLEPFACEYCSLEYSLDSKGCQLQYERETGVKQDIAFWLRCVYVKRMCFEL